MQSSITNLDKSLHSLNKLLNNADGKLGTLTASVTDTLSATREALKASEETITRLGEDFSDKSPILTYELSEALKELTTAARSLKVLTDYLQQHPESLLRGKGGK